MTFVPQFRSPLVVVLIIAAAIASFGRGLGPRAAPEVVARIRLQESARRKISVRMKQRPHLFQLALTSLFT